MRRLFYGVVQYARRVWAWFLLAVRKHPRASIITGGVLVAVVVLQLLYSADAALPFARLAGESVGRSSPSAITKKVKDEYATVPLTLSITGKQYKSTAYEAGLEADTTAIMSGLSSYSWWQRLIPFSLPVKGMLKDQPVTASLNSDRFDEYAKARIADCAVAPKNAGVIVKGQKVELDPSKDGQSCSVELLRKALESVALKKQGVLLAVKPTVVKPARGNDDVAALLTQAQAVIDRHVTLKLGDTQTSPDKATIASWLVFPEEVSTKKISISIDQQAVKKYLAAAQKSIYVAPGTTYVYTLDSVEIGRKQGSTGRGVAMNSTAAALAEQLLKGDGTVTADLSALTPSVAYARSYSATQAGLQALLDDLVKDKGDYGIAVRTADGSVVASANGSKQYHPASTYKMLVGWAIIKRIAAGQMNWDDAAVNGNTVSQCFDTMIINSDNACGEWLGEQIGWTNLNAMLNGIGFSCTNLSTAWYSCANDETLFLHKLATGQLLPSDQADRLLGVMKQQVYRSGIPTGVHVTVADKVGFLDGKLHDAGIVYAPQGTYSLTILTDGSSWAQIADTARQINAQLSQM